MCADVICLVYLVSAHPVPAQRPGVREPPKPTKSAEPPPLSPSVTSSPTQRTRAAETATPGAAAAVALVLELVVAARAWAELVRSRLHRPPPNSCRGHARRLSTVVTDLFGAPPG